MKVNLQNAKIAVIGLGYVGLPLAVEFGKRFATIGFDINEARIAQLIGGHDVTLELEADELALAQELSYSSDIEYLRAANIYVVTVPTPIDANNQPDLSPLIAASQMLGQVIAKGDIVIYESTVYPGATEEDCIPHIEKVSGLRYNEDFFAGYSPERINPGDKQNRLTNILKVTSGSNPEVADLVDSLYRSIIVAGTHKASSIRVAEASKVIENTQRDVNIALINEFYQIFDRMGISTKEVIEAAATKWNFMRLLPGLVGGHCIGVDPYYLLHKSQSYGYTPDLIRSAREINSGMSDLIANQFLRFLLKKRINPVVARVAILGFTFKENCPDIRNTKVIDLYKSLMDMGIEVVIYDPLVDQPEALAHYEVSVQSSLHGEFDAALLAVPHRIILDELKNGLLGAGRSAIFDFRGVL